MSSMKKAEYRGSSGTGVDLFVPLVDGQWRNAHVDPNHQLPRSFDGVDVVKEFYENLYSQPDWAEVKVNTDPPGKGDASDTDGKE